MPNERIFVFTAGDPAARAHLEDSIEKPVDPARIIGLFKVAEQEAVRLLAEKHGLYAWGAVPGKQNTPRWNAMKSGDLVLCAYENHYRYVARVLAKFDSEAFAKEIWGTDSDGDTWQLMYFLSRPERINIAVSDLSGYLNKGYRGFARIGDDRVERIESEFGSVEEFVEQQVRRPAIPGPYADINREDVLLAIRDFDAGVEHGFGPSTTYDLVHEGRTYPPKAIFGLAARRVAGRTLRPDEFSAGQESKCFAILRKLGFEIRAKEEPTYLLLRSNEKSKYQDELGKLYHFTINVPNYKKLARGSRVVFDRRTQSGVRVIGYGELYPTEEVNLGPATDKAQRIARFKAWTQIDPPVSIPEDLLARIEALPGYNQQHSIRAIGPEIYQELTMLRPPSGELVLLGTSKSIEEYFANVEQFIRDRGADARPWSFVIKQEAVSQLSTPFYVYINAGGGHFPARMRVVEYKTSAGTSGLLSPWPEITEDELKGKSQGGEQQSDLFKTWFRIDQIERLSTDLTLHDFVPAPGLSTENNLLNQNAFGYAYLKEQPIVSSRPLEAYSIDQALLELFMSPEELKDILNGLKRKKNVILEGPPGVGKTFAARLIAYAFMESKDDTRLEMVQFHQSYAYEDFVQGWRPKEAGGFELKDGLFHRFCRNARADQERSYVFIIDEVNRGNLSKIFGELLMLIEPDKRGPRYAIPLTYSKDGEQRFDVPPNVYLIGLMNTADRSLAMVDYALRRRFAFFPLKPELDSDRFRAWLQHRGATAELVTKIRTRLGRINDAIGKNPHLGKGFLIGHSYFCPGDNRKPDETWYKEVIATDVAPLIREYWSDNDELATEYVRELLQ